MGAFPSAIWAHAGGCLGDPGHQDKYLAILGTYREDAAASRRLLLSTENFVL